LRIRNNTSKASDPIEYFHSFSSCAVAREPARSPYFSIEPGPFPAVWEFYPTLTLIFFQFDPYKAASSHNVITLALLLLLLWCFVALFLQLVAGLHLRASVVVTLMTWLSLYVGWGSYMMIGTNPSNYDR